MSIRLWLLMLIVCFAGCSTGPMGFDATTVDAPSSDRADIITRLDIQDVVLPGRSCRTDRDCNDALMCTDDFCNEEGRCVNLAVDTRCDNNVFCDGLERCDTRRGCVRGTAISCDDDYVCTADRCIESTRTCEHRPLDRDNDGEPDWHCAARDCENDAGMLPDGAVCWYGHDCDDDDPRVGPSVPEICGDLIDNNCNGQVDMEETSGCVRSSYDQCSDPLDVSAGGLFTIPMRSQQPDYTLPCGFMARDAVVRLELTEPHDIEIVGSSAQDVITLGLQTVCGSTMSPDTLDCDNGFPSTLRRHSVQPGVYYIVVGSSGRGDVELSVRISDPLPAATNDRCEDAILVDPTGGTYRSDLIGLSDDHNGNCGGSARDAIYRVELTQPQDIRVRVQGDSRLDYLSVSLTNTCGQLPTEIRCSNGSDVQYTAHEVQPGTYYIVVESFDPIAYTLQVQLLPPTPPPPGDTCEAPLTLTPSMPVMIEPTLFESDYNLTCGATGRDSVYQFTTTETRDVTVRARGTSTDYFTIAMQDVCGSEDTLDQRACVPGTNPGATALNLPAGTYYVIVKPLQASTYTVSLETYMPLTPVMVTGNDVCENQRDITESRALFTGDTSTAVNNYQSTCAGNTMGKDVVFGFRLDTRQRVSFLTTTNFFHVAWIMQGPNCPGMAVSVPGTTCTLGTTTTVEAVLDPGEYRFILDSFDASSMGTYRVLYQRSAP